MARRRTQSSSSARGKVVLMSRSVFCSISGVSERELASWEREDLIAPVQVERESGQLEALYTQDALRRARVIRTLADELEVNIPGIGVILHLLDQMGRRSVN
jgi:DNA-binding transcriptional MerR regulator